MPWNNFYWDFIYKNWWDPQRMGLDKIEDYEDQGDGYLRVPAHYAKKTKIRHRAKTNKEVRKELMGDESALNDFFDITFSIAPDYLIKNWFCRPLAISSNGPFASLAFLETAERFRWDEKNITQHDGLYVSADAILCIELKLESNKALTDKFQLLKYISIIMSEEKVSQKKREIGLLYIVPSGKVKEVFHQIKEYAKTAADLPPRLNLHVRSILESDPSHFSSVVDRLRLAAISWTELNNLANAELDSLNANDAYQQTLHRLLEGFVAQLEVHGRTGI